MTGGAVTSIVSRDSDVLHRAQRTRNREQSSQVSFGWLHDTVERVKRDIRKEFSEWVSNQSEVAHSSYQGRNPTQSVASATLVGGTKHQGISRRVRKTSAIPVVSPACNPISLYFVILQDVAVVRRRVTVHDCVLRYI
jgi:hypothetical protein